MIQTKKLNGEKKRPPEPLWRAAAVLEVVAFAGPEGLEVAKVAQKTGLPLATAHRLVRGLVAVGYLEGGRNSGYRIGARLFNLLDYGVPRESLSVECRPILQRTADELSAIVFLNRASGRSNVTAVQAVPQTTHNSKVLLGTDAPLHATASGKLFLAAMNADRREEFLATAALPGYRPKTITDPNDLRREISRVAAQGYATCKDEYDEGVYALACPVEVSGNHLAFAAGVMGTEQNLLAEGREAVVLDAVRRMAKDLSSKITALFEKSR